MLFCVHLFYLPLFIIFLAFCTVVSILAGFVFFSFIYCFQSFLLLLFSIYTRIKKYQTK